MYEYGINQSTCFRVNVTENKSEHSAVEELRNVLVEETECKRRNNNSKPISVNRKPVDQKLSEHNFLKYGRENNGPDKSGDVVTCLE